MLPFEFAGGIVGIGVAVGVLFTSIAVFEFAFLEFMFELTLLSDEQAANPIAANATAKMVGIDLFIVGLLRFF